MEEYDLKKVYLVNAKLVVAENIEEAVKLYKAYIQDEWVEIKNINLMSNGAICPDYNAVVNKCLCKSN